MTMNTAANLFFIPHLHAAEDYFALFSISNRLRKRLIALT
jgi:hypothetical protein